jgi:hypothetical protein
VKFFVIEHELLLIDKNKSLYNLGFNVIKYIQDNGLEYIFVHNLGYFDGFYIYKSISKYFEPSSVKTFCEIQNRFITIKL